jgi:hypothetical protein
MMEHDNERTKTHRQSVLDTAEASSTHGAEIFRLFLFLRRHGVTVILLVTDGKRYECSCFTLLRVVKPRVALP